MTATAQGPCQVYDGTLNDGGYGVLPQAVNGSRLAHRAALAEKLGRPVEGHALHHCDNPPCIAPAHLYEGSPQDNRDDAVARGRARGGRWNQTHCKWGHELVGDNVTTYIRQSTCGPITARRCMTCRRQQNQDIAARRKAARNMTKMRTH